MTFTLLALILAAEPAGPVTAPPLLPVESAASPGSSPSHLTYVGFVPEGYHLVESANVAPITIGVIVFALSYVPWAVLGGMAGTPEAAVPIFGPLLGYREPTDVFSRLISFITIPAIAIDVLAQVSGAITLIVGLATPRRWLERDAKPPVISFVPGAAGAPVGASVVARF